MNRFLLSIFIICSVSILLSLVVSAQTNNDCLSCHGDASITMEKGGKQISIYVEEKSFTASLHGKTTCVGCHKGYRADEIPHTTYRRSVKCVNCHKEIQKSHVFHPHIVQSLMESKTSDIDCRECHNAHNIPSSKEMSASSYENRMIESCNKCHSAIFEQIKLSAHGQAVTVDFKGSPNCLTCHRYEISNLSNTKDSLKLKHEQDKLCLACHIDNPDVRARTTPSAGFIASYDKSVHAQSLRDGKASAAGCVDCHGSHTTTKASNPASDVNSANIAQMCGKCHGNITAEYNESIHGAALNKGVKDAPSCTDCHGEHEILSHANPKSRVEALNVSSQVCSPCHSSVRLTQKYGLSSDRFSTFADSYHGLANIAGSVEVANCASCHGVHNIKPSTDSTSMIHKVNLVQTCGKCHPGANERFIIGSVHVTRDPAEEPLLYWISTIYIVLIIITVAGMGIHNILDFVKKSKHNLLVRRGAVAEYFTSRRLYLRMTLNERIQHGILLISFTALVVTGFALRYPDAWWVVYIRNLSPLMFDIRSLVHRIAGIVLLGVSFYHFYYIMFVPRGKQLIRDLLPEMKDIMDLIGFAKYHIGLSEEEPKFKRFCYIEKIEYWALIWGTVIMGTTGIILWFDNTFLGLLTKIGFDAAREIHFYEAWLATLAIIVWHLYFVIFNPDVYPLNIAFLKGTLTEAEMYHEHPLELEEINISEAVQKDKKLAIEKKNTGEEIMPGEENSDTDGDCEKDASK